jgi:integrase
MSTRRGYGSGSLHETRPGVWKLRHQGRSRTVTGTRREAEQALAALVAGGNLTGPTPAVTTLGRLLDDWLAANTVQPSTTASYRAALAHLPAPLRKVRLHQLDLRTFDRLYADLDRKGVGRQQIRKLHTALCSALTEAVRWGLITHHPARGARLPELAARRVTIPTDDQITALLHAAADDPVAEIWLRLALAAGARRGEVLALRWSCVDLDTGTITISASLEEDRTSKTTKTNRVRTVHLDAGTITLLRRWRRSQREHALAVGARLIKDPWVITSSLDGSIPWRPDGATQRFRRLCTRAGITGIRLHDLRHAHASILLRDGVDVATVANRLGHATPRTTLDTYAHVLDGADAAAADIIGRRLAT